MLFDGNPVGTFTPAGSSFAAYNTSTFAASAGAHILSFIGLDPDGGDNTALIDQVHLGAVVASYGFEAAGVAAGTYQVAPAGTPLAWAGDAGIAADGSALGNPDAPQGSRAAFLQDTGSFSATGNLSGSYRLTFAAAAGAVGERFQVQVDGVVVGDFTPTDATFTAFSTDFFTVAAGPHTVSFVGLGGPGSAVFLDEVQLLR